MADVREWLLGLQRGGEEDQDEAMATAALAMLDDAERYKFLRGKLVSRSITEGGIVRASMTIGAAISGVDTPGAIGIPDALGWQLDANIDAARAGTPDA